MATKLEGDALQTFLQAGNRTAKLAIVRLNAVEGESLVRVSIDRAFAFEGVAD